MVFSFFGCATLVEGSKNQINYEDKLKDYHGIIYIRQKNGKEITGYLSSIDENQIVLSDKKQINYENIESIKIENKFTNARDLAFVPFQIFSPFIYFAGTIVVMPILVVACIFIDNCRT